MNSTYSISNVTSEVTPHPSSITVFRFVVNTCIQGPICLLGLLGNITAIIVLFKQKSKATTTIMLKALTIADSLYLISMFPLMSLRYIHSFTGSMQRYMDVFPVIFRWFYPQLYVYRTMITWLTVLLTIDRFIVVCKPLHAPRICTRKRAWAEVVLVILISIVYNIPRFFEYKLSDKYLSGYARTHMALNPYYVFLYRMALFLLLMYIVPLLILLIANSRLIIAFKKAEKMRSLITNQGKQKKDITYMVIATVFFFILANVPAFIAQLLWALYEVFKPSLNNLRPYYSYHSNISNILVTLNSGINVVIYCMCSRHFRRVLVRTVGCDKIDNNLGQPTSVTLSTRACSRRRRSLTFQNGSKSHYIACRSEVERENTRL